MPVTCPDEKTLERFLLGEVSDEAAVQLEEHLVACPNCLETAHTLAPDDTLVSAMRDAANLPPVDRARVTDLVEKLRKLRMAKRITRGGRGDGAVAVEDDLSDLLAPSEAADEIGRLGGYRIKRVIGSGGMGVVFEAEDPQLKRAVALKAMRPKVASSRAACERFLREAQSAAAIEHDHIVTIYHVGEDRGVPYLAMKLLEGESLHERLAIDARLPLADVLRISRQLAEGLGAAHRRGLLHRDIKPDNIWLEAHTNRVKIVDFGLARAAADDANLTHSGTILGTPRYMSPEQVRGDAVDQRCDLFSLGVVMYRAATGKAPFEGADLVSTLMAVAKEGPPAPRELCPEIPTEVSDLIMRLLEKDPADRYQSAAEVVEAIDRILADVELPALTSPSTPEAPHAPPAGTEVAQGADVLGADRAKDGPEKAADSCVLLRLTPLRIPAPGDVTVEDSAATSPPAKGPAGSHPAPDPASPAAGPSLATSAGPKPAKGWPKPDKHGPQPNKEGPKVAGADRRRWLQLGGGLLSLVLLLGAASYGVFTLRLTSAKGDVVIKCLLPEAEVLVKRGTETVRDFKLKQGANQVATLSVGEYEIAVRGANIDGVEIENRTFSLNSGDKVVVKVYREPPPVKPTPSVTTAPPVAPLGVKVTRTPDSVIASGIEVFGNVPIGRLVPGAGVSVGLRREVRDIPEAVRGRLYTDRGKHQGTTHFRVLQSQDVYLAVTPDWGGGGEPDATWPAERVTRAQLEDQGWKQIGELALDLDKPDSRVSPMLLFQRRCKKGEEFSIRTHKYNAPILIWGEPLDVESRRGRLLGRASVGKTEIGPSLVYQQATIVAPDSFLAELGDDAKRRKAKGDVRIEFHGVLHLSAESEVKFWMSGGSADQGEAELSIDGNTVATVGDDRERNVLSVLTIAAGDHVLKWMLTGGRFGDALLDAKDAKTGARIPFAPREPEAAFGKVRELPAVDKRISPPEGW